MTDEQPPAPIGRALDDHGAFEVDGDAYAATTTPFEATVTAAPTADECAGVLTVTVAVPTLSAAVEGDVAPVVEDGWFETLQLRLADAFDVTRTDGREPPRVDRGGRTVRVQFVYRSRDPRQGVDDAKALVDYVEGTYLQGIVPGYDYRDPVSELRARARETGESGRPG